MHADFLATVTPHVQATELSSSHLKRQQEATSKAMAQSTVPITMLSGFLGAGMFHGVNSVDMKACAVCLSCHLQATLLHLVHVANSRCSNPPQRPRALP